MPVCVYPSQNVPTTIRGCFHSDPAALLRERRKRLEFTPGQILQSSFGERQRKPPAVLGSDHGFVDAVIAAYSSHHHLRLRPEDIWLAALTQFSAYVNAHSEELRGHFVAHQGKKTLVIYTVLPPDYGAVAEAMSKLIEDNVIDPELREWMMPNFSTTTDHDTVVASIVMMGTMQKYFNYELRRVCGFPSVTLLGEKEDYEKIAAKIEKFADYGDEAAHFAALLRPILARLVMSFEDPTSEEVISFWHQALNYKRSGSGPYGPPGIYSGWISAFCFWTRDGTCQYLPVSRVPEYGRDTPGTRDGKVLRLTLDGIEYGFITEQSVPPGWTKAPILIIDGIKRIETEIVAGSVGIFCSASGDVIDLVGNRSPDTMAPQLGWWIYEKTTSSEGSKLSKRNQDLKIKTTKPPWRG